MGAISMLLLQSGLPKSGNLWLHKILQESLRLGGIESKSFIQSQPIYQEAKSWPGFSEQARIDFIEMDQQGVFYRKGAFSQPIKDLDSYLDQCTHVWTHTLWLPRCDDVFRKFEKIIYIIRDPRDVIVSASKFYFTPFMLDQHPQKEPNAETFLKHRLYEQVLTWIQHIGGYLLHADEYHIHFVFYERLLHDFDGEYTSLLAYLGIQLPSTAISEIKESVRFENMKRQNPYHLRKGEAGGWVNVLTPFQARQVAKMAGPIMAILGYAIEDANLMSIALPSMPARLDADQIRRAITAARGGMPDKLRYAWAFATSRRPLGEKLTKGVEFLRGKGRWNPNP
jgi:aryl sulfotransferase